MVGTRVSILGGAVGLCLCNLSGPVLCGEGKEIWNIRIPVHKACGAENHCSGEGDRFSSEPAGVRPVQRRVQLFHDRSSFGRSGSAGSGAFHNDGNVLYPASLFCLGSVFASLFKSYKAAVRAGTVFVLAAYVLAFTAEYTGNRFLDYLTPLRYYDVYEVALNGVYLSYIVLTVLIVGACVMVSTRRWKLREL